MSSKTPSSPEPAIFSLEYALAEMWKSKGVEPYAMLGHSVGEYAAAVVAGMMSVEDGMKLIAARGRLMMELCEAGVGTMKAVFASKAQVEAAMSKVSESEPELRESVAIAGVNGPKM